MKMISMEQASNTIIDSQAFSFEAAGKLAGHYDIQLIGHFNQENAVAAGLACLRRVQASKTSKKELPQPESRPYGSSDSEKTAPRSSLTTLTMVLA